MTFLIHCTIGEGRIERLKALRLRHLEYIRAHRDLIRFGGPTRGDDSMPKAMFIVVDTRDQAAAEAFIRSEPYNASGEVFASVEVRPWSQVVPDARPGSLDDEIAAERARSQGAL